MNRSRNRSVTSIGYLGQKSAIEIVEDEERLSLVKGLCRIGELREVKRFVNLFKEGTVLKVTLRRRTFLGTLLGYKNTNLRRGWVMGVLAKNGAVKEITIDPKGYEIARDEFLEILEDRNSKYICLVTPMESILQISPAGTLS